MDETLEPDQRASLEAYSRGEISALDLRRTLDDATFGDVLLLLRQAGLKLPRTPVVGREAHLARAAQWLAARDDG